MYDIHSFLTSYMYGLFLPCFALRLKDVNDQIFGPFTLWSRASYLYSDGSRAENCAYTRTREWSTFGQTLAMTFCEDIRVPRGIKLWASVRKMEKAILVSGRSAALCRTTQKCNTALHFVFCVVIRFLLLSCWLLFFIQLWHRSCTHKEEIHIAMCIVFHFISLICF